MIASIAKCIYVRHLMTMDIVQRDVPVKFCDDLVKISNQCNTSTARSTDIVSLYHYFEVLFPMQNLVNKWQQQCKKREISIF